MTDKQTQRRRECTHTAAGRPLDYTDQSPSQHIHAQCQLVDLTNQVGETGFNVKPRDRKHS